MNGMQPTLGTSRGWIIVPYLAALRRHDYLRFGLRVFRGRGYGVLVLDVGDLAFPVLKPTFERIRPSYGEYEDIRIDILRTWEEFADYERWFAGARLIVPMLGFFDAVLPAYELLGRIDTPYLIARNGAVPDSRRVPQPAHSGSSAASAGGVEAIPSGRPCASCRSAMAQGFRPADFVILGGRLSDEPAFPTCCSTEKIWAHSYDYDFHAESLATRMDLEPTAVFLDEYGPYHPDHVGMKLPPAVDAGPYYGGLRDFFDRVERDLGLRVVIAADPKADYSDKPGLFGPREIISGRTHTLVRKSSLVLAHRSSAIGYAVLNRKPIILFAMRKLYESHHRPYFDGFAKALGRPLLLTDEPYDLRPKDVFAIDEEKYTAYREDYIKTCGSTERSIWELVLERLERSNSGGRRGVTARGSDESEKRPAAGGPA